MSNTIILNLHSLIIICLFLVFSSCKSSDRAYPAFSSSNSFDHNKSLAEEYKSGDLRLSWYVAPDGKYWPADSNHKNLMILIPGVHFDKSNFELENKNDPDNSNIFDHIQPSYYINSKPNFLFKYFTREKPKDVVETLYCLGSADVQQVDAIDSIPDNNLDSLSDVSRLAAAVSSDIGNKPIFVDDNTDAGSVKKVCDHNRSYNVAIFDTSIFSDMDLEDFDAALWDSESSSYINDEKFLDLYVKISKSLMPDTKITVVGHSTGAGIALRLKRAVSDAYSLGFLPKEYQLTRVSLVEPVLAANDQVNYKSHISRIVEVQKGSKSSEHENLIDLYQLNFSQNKEFEENVRQIRANMLGSTYVKLSLDKKLFVDLDLSKNQVANSYPLYWYLKTLVDSQKNMVKGSGKNSLFYSPSGGSSVEYLKRLKSLPSTGSFKQTGGKQSFASADDEFIFQIKY